MEEDGAVQADNSEALLNDSDSVPGDGEDIIIIS